MYLWIALQLSNENVPIIREKVEAYCVKKGIETTALDLPQHVSLKISFKVSSLLVLDDIKRILGQQESFNIQFKSFDYHAGLLWMTFQSSPELESLHEALDELLLKKYHIPKHEFDKNYFFHSTLVYDMNQEVQVDIKSLTAFLNENVTLSKFRMSEYIFGKSPSGLPGTYVVIEKGSIGE